MATAPDTELAERSNKSSGWAASGRAVRWAAAAALLLVPLIAMRFTDEVQWTAFDFGLAAVLLFGTLGAFEWVTRAAETASYRAGVGVALGAGLLLVWSAGAVGIVGSENTPANLLYAAVLLTALIGGLSGRFAPLGISQALVVTAAVQVLVLPVASLARLASPEQVWAADALGLTGLFAALWLASAWLLRAAERSGQRAR